MIGLMVNQLSILAYFVVEWLIAEFDIYYLSYEDIASGIEQEAKNRQNLKILTFSEPLPIY